MKHLPSGFPALGSKEQFCFDGAALSELGRWPVYWIKASI
jgi:hypothetical protein